MAQKRNSSRGNLTKQATYIQIELAAAVLESIQGECITGLQVQLP